MRNVVLIVFMLIACVSCNNSKSLSKEIENNFTNRLEGHTIALSNKINTGGIYRYWRKDESGRPQKIPNTNDTAYIDMIFYGDGTFAWNIYPLSGYKNYEEYFKAVISKGPDHLFYKSHYWGIYSISNDTIKAQYLMHASPGTPWYTGESWYLIKSPTTLQLILFTDIEKRKEKNTPGYTNYPDRASLVEFKPVSPIPPPYGWIKKEKFFWRNEQDREKFMKEIEPNTGK
jgi:hypothetical protein